MTKLNGNEIHFTKTSIYRSAKSILMEIGVVFIVGPQGTGKTMMSYHLMKAVCSSKQDCWQPLILHNPDEWRQLVHPETYEVILMDNLFGEHSFDIKPFNMLKRMLDNTKILKTKRIIFTIRTQVFNEGLAQFKQFALYNSLCCVNITRELPDGEFSMKEKNSILFNHLIDFELLDKIDKEVIKAIIECKSHPCFPICCKLFCMHPRLHVLQNAVMFFERPIMHLTNEIREFYNGSEHDKAKYGALILTMVKNGMLHTHELDEFHKKECHDELRSYLRTVGISDNVSLATIRESANNLLGSYLMKKDLHFSFSNPSIHDAVLYVYGEFCPDHMVDVCPVSFLHKYVISSDQPGNYLKLSLNIEILTKRFIKEIQEGRANQVCTHQAFSEESFVKLFESICTYINRMDILTSVDSDMQLPLLYWAVWSKNGMFFEYILKQHTEQKQNLDCNVKLKIATACCITGNIDALRCIDSYLNTDLLGMQSTCVPVPYVPTTNAEAHTCNDQSIHVGQLIHVACVYGYIRIVEYLVNKGSNKNAQDSFGRTPSCITAKYGHVELFELLLRLHCNLNLKTISGNMAIHEACVTGQTKIVKTIFSKYPNNVFVENSNSRTPLELAIMNGRDQLVQFLLGLEGILNHERERDSILLHLACKQQSESMVLKILCEVMKTTGFLKHFMEKHDSKANTPLHVACETVMDVKTVKMLIEFGANTNSLNEMGQTPLHLVCANITSLSCSTDLLKILISHGAQSFFDNKYHMPIDYVSDNKDVKKKVEQLMYNAIRGSIIVA